jgi:lysophospholipase L1-like esterase
MKMNRPVKPGNMYRATCFFLMAIVLVGGVWSCKEKEALRIMPIGDSITAGYTDNPDWTVPFEFGYRAKLYQLLDEANYHFEFVGQSAEPWDSLYGLPFNTPSFDLRKLGQDRHRGYGGWGIPQIQAQVTEWILQDRPDVILLMIGINGINPNSPQQLEALVDTIFSKTKDVHLILAQITPYGEYNQALYDYNLHVKNTLVPIKAAEGFKISTVDLYSLFLSNPEDPTSITKGSHSNPPHHNHPTKALYDKMAESWFNAIANEFER